MFKSTNMSTFVEGAAAPVYVQVRVDHMLDLEGLIFGRVDLPLHVREEAHQKG
jgi:hypothetical protein